jgi:hypothetical protein
MRLVSAATLRRRSICAALLLAGLGLPDAVGAQGFEDEVAFLTAPMGARMVGIGRAAASIRGELQGVPWNPATLGTIDYFEPLASHYDGPLDFRFNNLAVAVPVGSAGVFAVSANVQSFGEITLSSSPDVPLGTITPSNLVLGLSYGRQILPRFGIGLTAKWVRSELSGDLTGDTFAFDAGLLWRPAVSLPLDIGASVLNVGRGLSIDGAEPSPLPGRLRLGASYDVLSHLQPEGRFSLLLAVDLEHALRDLSAGSQFFGAEFGAAGILFLRGGYIAETLIDTNTGGTVGVGLALGRFRFDIARELGVNQLGDETHISLAARL